MRCHENCIEARMYSNKLGDPLLRNCDIFRNKVSILTASTRCGVCGCSWRKHMHLTIDYVIEKQPITDVNRVLQLSKEEGYQEALKRARQQLKNLLKEYREELSVIQDIGGLFGCLLEKYSNTSFNRFIEPHLELLIKEEKKKMAIIQGYSSDTFHSIVKLRDSYSNNVERIRNAIQNGDLADIQLGDIQIFHQKLLSLPHSGSNFRMALDAFLKSEESFSDEHQERIGITLLGY